MVETVVCRSCGSRPCRCAAPAAGEGSSHKLRLLPPVAGTALEPVDAERFTRLLREVKAGVVARSFVTDDDAEPLLRRMRRLGRWIERGDLAHADAAATAELAAILQFPRRRRSPVWAVVLLVAALAVLAWCLTP
jgi:hypothetical protein